MHLTLSPMRRSDRLNLHRAGDVLTINGVVYDFGPLPDGATLPREAVECDWLASDIERIGGVLHLTLMLPHGTAAPDETLFPTPLDLTHDGPVDLPPYETEIADAD